MMIDKVMEFSTNLSNQRHINAVRQAFYAMMPLVIAAALFVLINNVLLSGAWVPDWLASFKDIGDRVYRGTLGIMTISLCAATAYYLAQSYKVEGIPAAVISLACLISLTPAINNFGSAEMPVEVWGIIHPSDVSATGLFVGFAVALLATELFIKLNTVKALKITMPEGVPPAVASSFSKLFPAILTVTIFAIFGFLLHILFDTTLNSLVIKLIQTPMQHLMNTFVGFLVVVLVQQLLWTIGLHGPFITGPIVEPIMLASIASNMEAVRTGVEIPFIITKSFLDSFVMMGGSGGTIALIFALFIFSRRKDHRAVGKISLVPGLFNINETVMFGLPIVLNPIFVIPFVLGPVVSATIAYWATALGLVAKTTIMIPWTTPPVVGAYLATAGDWRAAVLALMLLAISVLIYAPFVIAANKMVNKE